MKKSLQIFSLEELKFYQPTIYNIVSKYYPLGIKKNSKAYQNHIGIIFLKNEIINKIENKDNFNENWEESVLLDIKNSFKNYTVTGATYGFVPNYGGIIQLEQSNKTNLTVELHFYVSFIENIFTIQIVSLDNSIEINYETGSIQGPKIKELIVSPVEGYYKDIFLTVENTIRDRFKNSKFLPYSIESIELSNFEVFYTEGKNCHLGQAFFLKGFPYTVPEKIIGDINYKIDEIN
ncbi:hypothetical protein [Flavobacterium luminosum]|uniref:Uncharacterized protein n=1 Tax=Flavobacterium luminosum TaxID=2949086 RepID=A0ABT0TPI5_9FLAO|nr:hypothetical protein [Flavobacterium sp. HXWNR70]MCL9808979.1 hypothetical protein [Flavobacterium sp. HXWNR70]